MVKYLPRLAEAEVEGWLDQGKSVVLVGPRQAGKTTLLKHLAEKHGWEYITLDIPRYQEEFSRIEDVPKLHSSPLLIDEGQYDPEIGRKLKYLYDVEGFRFVASGSGSFDVKVKVSGELVGRAARVELLPLSFGEFVLWRDENIWDVYRECRKAFGEVLEGRDREPPLEYSARLEELWKEYVIFGGYPEVVLHQNREDMLEQIYKTYLDRDVVGFLGVREYWKFSKLLRHLVNTLTTPFKKSTAMNYADISYKTLETYVSILLRTFIVFEVPPLATYSSVKKMTKIYFYDNGIINTIKGDFRPFDTREDGAALLENYVARHLLDYGKVYYYRSDVGEVDFVVRGTPLEVKLGDRASRSLYSLSQRLGRRGILVRPGRFERREKVYMVPPWCI